MAFFSHVNFVHLPHHELCLHTFSGFKTKHLNCSRTKFLTWSWLLKMKTGPFLLCLDDVEEKLSDQIGGGRVRLLQARTKPASRKIVLHQSPINTGISLCCWMKVTTEGYNCLLRRTQTRRSVFFSGKTLNAGPTFFWSAQKCGCPKALLFFF